MKKYFVLIIESGDTFIVENVVNQTHAINKLNSKLNSDFDETDMEIHCIEDCKVI